MMFASAAAIRREIAHIAAPPNREPVAVRAAQYVRIRSGSGEPEAWSPGTTPYMVAPLNTMSQRRYQAGIFIGPARTGKTAALLAWTGHTIVDDPGDMLIVHATQEKAKRFSRKELKSMIAGSPEIAAQMSTNKHDDGVHAIYFRNGMVLYIGWPSDSMLRAETLRKVAITDYDAIVHNSGKEGSVFRRALKRLQTTGSRAFLYCETSPGFDVIDPTWRASSPHEAPPTHGGLALYNQGTRERQYLLCPECGERFIEPVSYESAFSFRLPEDLFGQTLAQLPERWGLICGANGCLIPPAAEKAVKASAVWVPEGCSVDAAGIVRGVPNATPYRSWWMSGVTAAYQSWPSLLLGYLQAKSAADKTGDEDDLRAVTNTDMGAPYLPRARRAERDSASLRARCEPFERGIVPPPVRFLLARVDVQCGAQARFVVQVDGYAPGCESWVVDRYAIKWSERANRDAHQGGQARIDPAAYPEDWDLLLAHVLHRRYPLASNPALAMRPHMMLVDTGGSGADKRFHADTDTSTTDQAYQFWRRCRDAGIADRVRLTKGAATRTGPRVHKSYPDNTSRSDRKARAAGDVPVWLLNVHELKTDVHNALSRADPGPGCMHWPTWLPDSFFSELLAEKLTAAGWIKIAARNETLDLYAMGRAGWHMLGCADSRFWADPPPGRQPRRWTRGRDARRR